MQKETVLLAEDEENDIFLMRCAIQKMGEPVLLQAVKDGEQAIEYLSGQNQYADRRLYPLPSLILLDVKMPRTNGLDVLKWLKNESLLTHIPVVMITSSKVQSDVRQAREMGASDYLVKPVDHQKLESLFAKMEGFAMAHAVPA